jgi:DHA1 family bicyclomycin/chloramphenicol resistance-like MFS transporter
MYIPSLPILTNFFAVSEPLINLTLTLFFVFMLVSMLIFGPISDRYGRRPILFLGCTCFVLASLACALANSVEMLIAARILQAISAGMVEVVGVALVKDCFDGSTRENVLIWSQVAFVLGPIAAPLAGGLILAYASWQMIFAVLAGLGAVGLVATFFFPESLPPTERVSGALAASFNGLIRVVSIKPFMVFMLVTMVFAALPFTAYLMAAPYVYEVHFGFSPQEYSYFFGATAAFSVLGIPFYKLAKRKVSLRHLTTAIIIIAGLAGLAMLLFAQLSVWVFFASILGFYIVITMVRPYSLNLLLGMCAADVGSASSVINCAYTVCGIIGTLPLIIAGGYYSALTGGLIILGCLISLALWIYLLRSPLLVPGVKDK